MMLLSDEEISKIRYKYNELYKGGVFEHTMRPNHCELVAKAQLKKVLEAFMLPDDPNNPNPFYYAVSKTIMEGWLEEVKE